MSNAVAVASDDAPSARFSWAEVRVVLGVGVQLGLLVGLTRALEVISKPFGNLMVLALIGFVIHALLPMRYRLGFFLLLSLAGIQLVLGTTAMLWLLGLGIPLVGLTYLPIRFGYRLALLGAAVAVLIILRGELLPNGVPNGVWPVLGSMFMIRMVLYLYDLSHAAEPPPLVRSLSYFFLLPNVCMPLFPAVDFKTYERTYFDTDAYRIYQRGLHWMARGLLQIVIYRLVYHHFTLDATEVVDAGQLLQYVMTSFMVYLRLSGTFHMAIGLLHLFGFHLPETNHLYWLSAGFTDLFRRNNIYWRDATIKLVYYPMYFRLRGRSPAFVTTVSLALVFLVTWLGHSWMWFWLRGAPLLTVQDLSFYAVLGTLITYQAVQDLKKPRTKVAVPLWSLNRGLSVLATMSTLCFLWSYWSAGTIAEWLTIWDAALVWNVKSVAMFVAVAAVGIGLGGARFGVLEKVARGPGTERQEARRSLMITLATTAVLAILANPSLPGMLNQTRRDFLATIRENRLNRRDEGSLLRGYYEQLDLGSSQTNELQAADAARRRERIEEFETSSLWHKASTPMLGELAPNVDTLWRGVRFATNEFGLRDGPYTLAKPPRTFRIAVVGPSDVMGSGVANDQTFEAILEQQLNAQNARGKYDHIEVLNFGVARSGVWQRAWLLDSKVPPFDPDLVLFAFHPGPDRGAGVLSLERALKLGVDPVFPEITRFVDSLGFKASQNSPANLKMLMPQREAFLDLSVGIVARVVAAHQLPLVLLYVRQPTEMETGQEEGLALATKYRLPFIDMMDFEDQNEELLRMSEWDKHPSVQGHQYLADRLFRELGQHGYLAAWGVTGPAADASGMVSPGTH